MPSSISLNHARALLRVMNTRRTVSAPVQTWRVVFSRDDFSPTFTVGPECADRCMADGFADEVANAIAERIDAAIAETRRASVDDPFAERQDASEGR